MKNKDVNNIKNAIDEKLKIYKSEPISKYKELDLDSYPLNDCKDEDSFYEDAIFLKDYVYQTAWYTHSPANMRSFCDMNLDNLYTYIAWRTLIRKGKYTNIDKEYIYIYINEILNLVGVTPNEGLDKLIFLWDNCDSIEDKEFFRIIKDYCIMYSPAPFEQVISQIPESYRQNISLEDKMYDGDFSDSLKYLNDRSAQHKVIGSSFYDSEQGKVLDIILPFVINEVIEYYKEKGYDFVKMLFEKVDMPYTLFNDNPFVRIRKLNKKYSISKYEYYYLSDDILFVNRIKYNNIHNRLISHIFKVTESRVRENLTGKPLRIYKTQLYAKPYIKYASLVNDELDKRINRVIDSYLKNNKGEIDSKKIEKEINTNFENVLKQMKLLSFTESGRVYGVDLFAKQVSLLEGVEYNLDVDYILFRNSYPSYSIMTVDMLKSYFSFRTKVRKGIYEKVDIGYIKLYLNELMLLCGCKDVDEALDKFTDFWVGMRSFVKNIDDLMEKTIKEFYIFNDINVPYSKVCNKFPDGYITDSQLDEEILSGDFSNFILFITRRVYVKTSKNINSTLKKFLPEVIKSIDAYLKESNYSVNKLLFGDCVSLEYDTNETGYIVKHTLNDSRKVITISKYEKYFYDGRNLMRSFYEVGQRERTFTKYIVNIAIDITKNNIPKNELLFSGNEKNSYHAQLIDSWRFIDLFIEVYEKCGFTYVRNYVNNSKSIGSLKYGDRVYYFDKQLTGDLSRLMSSFASPVFKSNDLLKIFDYLNNLNVYSFHVYSYSRNNSYSIMFFVKALLICDIDCNDKEVWPIEKYSFYNDIYDFDYFKCFKAYLYWRTNVRNGVVEECDITFILNYLSEVINLIGFKSKTDAFYALVKLWNDYSKYENNGVNFVLEQAVRDFFVYYDMGDSFEDIRKLYPKSYKYSFVSLYDSYQGNYESVSEFILERSSYRYVGSAFGLSENGHLINECMPFVLKHLDKLFREYDFSLPCFSIGGKSKKDYSFFDIYNVKFLYFMNYKDFAKLNNHDIYRIDKFGRTERTYNMYDDTSREFASIITKLTEIALREITDFKGKLKSPLIINSRMNNRIVNLIETIGADRIYDCVKQATMNFMRQKGYYVNSSYAVTNVKPVKVEIDFSKLDDIRKVSDELCDMLVIDDDKVLDKEKREIIKKEDKQIDKYDTIKVSPWKAFFSSLNELHINVLKAMLQGADVNAIARNAFVLPEVIFEEINEMALEYIGDTVIDTDSTLIEDYKDDILNCIEKGQGI